MNIFGRLEQAWNTLISRSRRRSKIFDHAWAARDLYSEMLGGRLAAAIAYYGFFAVFALALVAYSIVGFVLANNNAAANAVERFLRQNIPFLDVSAIVEARNAVAIIGLIGLIFTGVGWISTLRSSQRAIWGVSQQPGNFIIRRILDLGIMAGIGLLLALSLWVLSGINDALKPVLMRMTPGNSATQEDVIGAIARAVGYLLGLVVNVILAASLLSGVSRLRMSPRRLIPSALLVGVGLTVLGTVGRLYVDYGANRPVYKVVGGTVALLLFLYLFNHLLLYGAALAATSKKGVVVDLAAEQPPPPEAPAQEKAESTGTRVGRRAGEPATDAGPAESAAASNGSADGRTNGSASASASAASGPTADRANDPAKHDRAPADRDGHGGRGRHAKPEADPNGQAASDDAGTCEQAANGDAEASDRPGRRRGESH